MLVTELPGNAWRSSLIEEVGRVRAVREAEQGEREEDERHEREQREVRHHRRQVGAPVGEELLNQEPFPYLHGREFAPC